MKVLDLFSGIGGFSLGLERAGMDTIAFCEQDAHCQQVLKKHWPQTTLHRNIVDLTKYDFLGTEVDVICGGFPCQDISVAGNKKGLEGERSGLWYEFKRIIKEVKPRYAIIENVPNLRSKGLATILQDLWEIGYDAEWHIISARAFGAPHLRERIWIIAYPNTPELRKQQGRRSRSNREDTLQSGTTSEERGIESPDTCSEGLQGLRSTCRIQKELSSVDCDTHESTNTDNLRLWKPFTSQEEKQIWWAETTSSVNHWKETESIVCGVDDGLSRGLDKDRRERIKQLGNSLLPQIAEFIGRSIMEYEKKC